MRPFSMTTVAPANGVGTTQSINVAWVRIVFSGCMVVPRTFCQRVTDRTSRWAPAIHSASLRGLTPDDSADELRETTSSSAARVARGDHRAGQRPIPSAYVRKGRNYQRHRSDQLFELGSV